jgi:hypothetical protein
MDAIARESISPGGGRSPDVCTRTAGAPSPNSIWIDHALASEGSLQRKVGGVISGGKTDPSSG